MLRLKIGDAFQICTDECVILIHYVYDDARIGQMVRVLSRRLSQEATDFDVVVRAKEDFTVFFPLKAAARQGIVKRIGHYEIPHSFCRPERMRVKHSVGRETQGWYIVDVDSWQREFVHDLTKDQVALSPWGVWNDTLLIERVCGGWTLETWS